ncbi:MAG: biopolymer transporter ExbD [Planctomycetota bacterium]|nr:biopolymer transporter ExbD [Planctomycetota bacterium]
MKNRNIKQGVIGLNLTSMIDVVFLLLIYFMVATEFKTSEAAFAMDLPERIEQSPMLLDDEPLIILVDSAGDKQHDVRLLVLGPWGDIQTPEALRVFLHRNLADGFGNEGYFTLDHPIVVRPTKDANWEHVLAVYNAAVQASYTNITLDEPAS